VWLCELEQGWKYCPGLVCACVIFYTTQVANSAIFLIFLPQSLYSITFTSITCVNRSWNWTLTSTVATVGQMASGTAPYACNNPVFDTYTSTHGQHDVASDLCCLPQQLYAYAYNVFQWSSAQWQAFFAPVFACSHASISGSPGDNLACITESLLKSSCCDGSVLWHYTFYLGRFWAVTTIGFHVRDLPLHCVFLVHILAAGVL
jgi:hypothetical protein